MNNPMYRPPAEAYSLILQVDEGCPYNSCTFCGMYKGVKYERRNIEQIRLMVESVRDRSAKRIFLADGDVCRRPFDELSEIMQLLNSSFQQLARINTYATGSGILGKCEDELRSLHGLKLHTLYMGLESGDEETLKTVNKGETAEEMVRAAVRAKEAGLHMSVMVLLGLAGEQGSDVHARETAMILNRMQPQLLSFLRVVPVPGTVFHDRIETGKVLQLSEYGVVRELRDILSCLDLERTVIRANHSSNIVPVEARFPRDRERVVDELTRLMSAGFLDRTGPGPMPLSL